MRTIYKWSFIALSGFLSASGAWGQEVRFHRDLSIGDFGTDVALLQKILNQDNDTLVALDGHGSVGLETDYFGQKTKDAVIRYQQKYNTEILLPLGLAYGTGRVGLMTRNKLNNTGVNITGAPIVLPVNIPIPPPTANVSSPVKLKAPTIESVSPLEVSDPRKIPLTIKGANFSAQNKVLLGIDQYEIFNAPSLDGKTIQVYLDTILIAGMERLMNSIPKTPGGNEIGRARASIKEELGSKGKDGLYVPAIVVVENQNGRSDKVMIKINVLRDDKEF